MWDNEKYNKLLDTILKAKNFLGREIKTKNDIYNDLAISLDCSVDTIKSWGRENSRGPNRNTRNKLISLLGLSDSYFDPLGGLSFHEYATPLILQSLTEQPLDIDDKPTRVEHQILENTLITTSFFEKFNNKHISFVTVSGKNALLTLNLDFCNQYNFLVIPCKKLTSCPNDSIAVHDAIEMLKNSKRDDVGILVIDSSDKVRCVRGSFDRKKRHHWLWSPIVIGDYYEGETEFIAR